MANWGLKWFRDFVAESNRIEGITRSPTKAELDASVDFLTLHQVSVLSLQTLVSVLQPRAVLRKHGDLNVRVGSHVAPPGGPEIVRELEAVCEAANNGRDPHLLHHAYETLHPFTDGNGRSGRMLWLWGMRRRGGVEYERVMALGFLHSWYYQSLEAGPFRAEPAPPEAGGETGGEG